MTFKSNSRGCQIGECQIGKSLTGLLLENEWMSVCVVPEKGAEIRRLVFKPKQVDVLWQAPWLAREPRIGAQSPTDSATFWLEHYAGGWQEIFPNAGDACLYRGVELGFHGEASVLPWSYEVVEDADDRIVVRFSVDLYRSPFSLCRTLTLKAGEPSLFINEMVYNHAAVDMEFVWGHHPALGEPFLSSACVIDTDARSIVADDIYDPPSNPFKTGAQSRWPHAAGKNGEAIDISRVPSPDTPLSCLLYLINFEEGWYAVTNTEMGLGVGMAWPKEVLPYTFFWQEAPGGSPDFPFYGRAYTTAIEPFSSIPGQGLQNVINKTGTQLRLSPGGSLGLEMCVVFFESAKGVQRIDLDGTVTLK